MRSNDIEALRKILDAGKVYIAAGQIKQLELLSDRSIWNAKVQIFPENYELICRITWPMVGPNSGIFGPPEVNDLVLIAIAPEINQSFVIQRLSSREDSIPQQAGNNNVVIKSNPGKKTYIASDTKVFLSRLNEDPTEPVLLGNVMKSLLSYVLGEISTMNEKIAQHYHAGNLGYPTSIPTNASDFVTIKSNIEAKKANPVDNNAINSDISFTEK